MITNRLIVDVKVYDQFVERFSARVRGLKVGDPYKPETAIGPIINESQFQGLSKHIENAGARGARQTAGGDPKVSCCRLMCLPMSRRTCRSPRTKCSARSSPLSR